MSKAEQRRGKITAFWTSVDTEAANLAVYRTELSFQAFWDMVHERANLIQGQMQVGGAEEALFKVAIPKPFFCAILSSIHVNREIDVSYRYNYLTSKLL